MPKPFRGVARHHRDALVQDSLHSETADAAGVLSLIYDHHVRDLSRKLTERQHDAHGLS